MKNPFRWLRNPFKWRDLAPTIPSPPPPRPGPGEKGWDPTPEELEKLLPKAPKPEKPKKEEPKKLRRITLTIFFKDGASQTFWIDNLKCKDVRSAFMKFYKWWFRRKSPHYWFGYKTGGQMLRREGIKSWSITESWEKPE